MADRTESSRLGPTDRGAIESLSLAYASGVDQRRYRDVAELFSQSGLLQGAKSERPDVLIYDLDGRDAIEQQLRGLDRFDRTFHQLGQVDVWASDDGAAGEVYCTATHATTTDDSQSMYVMHIRYEDRYQREPDGWRIARRFLWVDMTEQRRHDRPD